MRRLLYVLCLLALPVHASILPYSPTPEGASFYVDVDGSVALCVVGGSLCGTPVFFKADPNKNPSNNCGIAVKRPATYPTGAAFECRIYDPVTPPVTPPPPVTPITPDGWVKVGDYCEEDKFCTFDVFVFEDIKLCDVTFAKCSSTVEYRVAPNVHYACNIGNFKDFPTDAKPFMCIAKAKAIPTIDFKLPALSLNVWNEFKTGDVPEDVSTRFTSYVVWRGSDGLFYARMGKVLNLSTSELIDIIKPQLKDDATFNAWVRTMPISATTKKEEDFIQARLHELVVSLAPKFVVQSSSTNKRPYYKPNATMTAIGTKLGDVDTLTPCDSTKRLGTTNYYFVPVVILDKKIVQGASGYSACILVK